MAQLNDDDISKIELQSSFDGAFKFCLGYFWGSIGLYIVFVRDIQNYASSVAVLLFVYLIMYITLRMSYNMLNDLNRIEINEVGNLRR